MQTMNKMRFLFSSDSRESRGDVWSCLLKTHISAVNWQITQIKCKDLFLEEEREITVSAAVTTLLFTSMINLSVIFLPAGSELSVVASWGCFWLSRSPENSPV